MEFTLTGKECSNAELFSRIGAGNYLHVPLEFYSYDPLRECPQPLGVG